MNAREKTLAGAIGVLVIGWVLWQGIASYQAGYDRRVATLQRLEIELSDEQFAALRARAALERLGDLRDRSLPSDPDVARSEYAEWLKGAVEEAGLELDSVKFAGARQRENAATELTFGASAEGPPEAVVSLLEAYYRLPALHQLTKLDLRSADPRGATWRVAMTSVALVVEGATREVGLPPTTEPSPRLNRTDASDYVASIVGRNLFARYTPPPPPKPKRKVVARAPKPEPPSFDDARHAQLTGIVETGERLQAWIRVRTTGETLRLHAGDPIEVGALNGVVQAVLPREIVVEADGVTWRTALGAKLRDGSPAGATSGDGA